jgi:hypothetical protein
MEAAALPEARIFAARTGTATSSPLGAPWEFPPLGGVAPPLLGGKHS